VDEAVSWLEAHPNTLVEITLVTESFLTAEERKRLNEAHDGIVAIIPQVKSAKMEKTGAKADIDLNKKMEELFSDYFRYKYEQPPNEEILQLFREIVAEEEAK